MNENSVEARLTLYASHGLHGSYLRLYKKQVRRLQMKGFSVSIADNLLCRQGQTRYYISWDNPSPNTFASALKVIADDIGTSVVAKEISDDQLGIYNW